MINIPENYNEYVKILESNGFHKQNKIDVITEESKLVTIKSCKKGQSNRIVNIECPENTLWIISPDNLVSLNIKDENGTEIDENVRLRICHIRPSEFVNHILHQPYYNFKLFKWKDNLKYFKKILGGDNFIIALINSHINIPEENIKFKITFDCWTRN